MADKFLIDTTMPALTNNKVEHRVYHWTKRPDAELHVPEDQEHWCLDSVHDTAEKAEARVKELKGGAKPKRISDDLNAASQQKVN